MTKSSIKGPTARRLLSLFAVGAFLLAPGPVRAEEGFRVVTTIAPLYSLTAGVMEGVAEPQLLMKAGDSPHHFTMKPKDAQRLMSADVIICTSPEFEYYLKPLIAALPERRQTVVEALATPGLTLVGAPELTERPEIRSEEYVDMHFWLDPVNAIAFTQYIAEALAEADPEHAGAYADNAVRQVKRLETLNQDIAAMLHAKSKKPQAHYASYHASLRYFENRYGIRGGKAITRTPESGASVEEADRLHEGIETGELRCLFQEPEFSPRLLKQAAKQHPEKVRLLTLDTLGSTYPASAEAYDAMMRGIAEAVSGCVSE